MTPELRWHPLLRQWVGVAAFRQDRPQMPSDWCPFCPGSGRVPDNYDVLIYPNDFAAFRLDAPFNPNTGLFCTTGARGVCDVVLYHPDHHLQPSELSVAHWRKIVDLWTRRSNELAVIEDIQYVYVFENTGVAIGVTMPHPHGQIYAFPFIPPLLETEARSAREHHSGTGSCLYCEILQGERGRASRVFFENRNFTAFVPFFARFPAEGQIYARRHFGALADMTAEEANDLAEAVSVVRRKYDNLYGFPMPLMMLLRQSPAKGKHPYHHFHIEIDPVQRTATKLKYLAGVESGAGTFLNDAFAEDKAKDLREAEPLFAL